MANIKQLYEAFTIAGNIVAEKISEKNNIHLEFEPKFYEDYGWFCGWFNVDKFGGGVLAVKYYNGKWFFDEKELGINSDGSPVMPFSIENQKILEKKAVELYKIRVTDKLADFINSQNED